MAKKATAHDAALIMKLYDLRREAEMRKADTGSWRNFGRKQPTSSSKS